MKNINYRTNKFKVLEVWCHTDNPSYAELMKRIFRTLAEKETAEFCKTRPGFLKMIIKERNDHDWPNFQMSKDST